MITTEQETAIRDVLATMPTLAVGVGTREQACSVAALNLALTGTLTDVVPNCMSRVIGRWIIGVQDKAPATIRNSAAWRELLVLAAGTGREREPERRALVLGWMWEALALVQPRADVGGYGDALATMLRKRAVKSADAAAAAAYAAVASEDADAAAAEYAAAYAAEYAASAAAAAYADAAAAAAASAAAYAAAAYADAAASAAAYAAAAYADADAAAAAYAAAAAVAVADAAAAAYAAVASEDAVADAYASAWDTIDPVGLLRRLVAVTDARALAVQP